MMAVAGGDPFWDAERQLRGRGVRGPGAVGANTRVFSPDAGSNIKWIALIFVFSPPPGSAT